MAYSAAHIQLAVRPDRQIRLRVLHTAPDVALIVSHHKQRSQGAVALDAEGHAGPLALQVATHHGACRQQAAQRRRSYRRGLMNLPGAFRQLPRRHRCRLHKAIFGDGAYKLIAHILK